MKIVFTVPQSHCVIVERFGKYSRTCNEGLNIRIPLLERIRALPEWGSEAVKSGHIIELTEQQTDTPPRQCHTKDNVAIEANASIYWRIVEPVRAVYEVDVLPRSISDVALNALRSNIGALDLDQVLSERPMLNERIAAQLGQVAQKWGVQFTRVEIQELNTTDDTATAMRHQMEAERRRRATVAEAEGKAEAEVKVAEAERKALVLRADGQAKALQAIGEAERGYLQKLSQSVDPHSAASILVAQKYLQGLEKITANPADKVFLPNSFNGLFPVTADAPRTNGLGESAEQKNGTSVSSMMYETSSTQRSEG